MRDILSALIEDASRRVDALETAARRNDAARAAKIARAAASSCANVGAFAAAQSFRDLERHIARRPWPPLLASVRAEIDRLRAEAAAV